VTRGFGGGAFGGVVFGGGAFSMVVFGGGAEEGGVTRTGEGTGTGAGDTFAWGLATFFGAGEGGLGLGLTCCGAFLVRAFSTSNPLKGLFVSGDCSISRSILSLSSC